jgi:hypothetical protein
MAVGGASRTFLMLAGILLFDGCCLWILGPEQPKYETPLGNEQENNKKQTPSASVVSHSTTALVAAPVACNLGVDYPIPNTTACAIFYPARLTGSKFYETRYPGHQQVVHLRRKEDTVNDTHIVPESITYLHNRKVGGTKMHAAFIEANGTLGLDVALSWSMPKQMGLRPL